MAATRRLLALLALGLSPALASAEGPMDLYRRLSAGVVKVEALNGDGSVSLGSGVVVGRGLVATNCHVTRNAEAIELVRGALRRSVESQHSEIEHDLCLLYSSQAQDEAIVEVERAQPRVGQAVYAVGFVLGIVPRLNAGEISAVHTYDGGKVIETDAAFASGASGGGLFEPDGKLIGLVTFKSRLGEAGYFCLPARWVLEALERFDGRPVAPLTGSTFWQRPAADQPYFLRAATFEAAREWQQLADVARQWSFAEDGNASSWFVLGKANSRLHRNPEAIAAYRAAVAIESDFAPAWYGLGRAYQESGQNDAVRQVHDVLITLDPRLAQALSQPACPEPRQGAC